PQIIPPPPVPGRVAPVPAAIPRVVIVEPILPVVTSLVSVVLPVLTDVVAVLLPVLSNLVPIARGLLPGSALSSQPIVKGITTLFGSSGGELAGAWPAIAQAW